MKKQILFLSLLFISGLFVQAKENKKNLVPEPQNTSWKSLSVREKIGQVMCIRTSYSEMLRIGNGSLEDFFKKYPVGSIFVANWDMAKYAGKDSLDSYYRNIITKYAKATKTPLLYVEDFENGVGALINRHTEFTKEMGLGATNSAQYANDYGRIVAQEAHSIGINWILHPVADLNFNPFNSLTNARALTDDVNKAVRMLPSQIQGIQDQKVAATAKHFPGDGTDYINQHFNTSPNTLSYKLWKKQHGRVFKKVIDEGVLSIMIGHISFPAYQKEKLDGEYLPASLSKELVSNLLKNELGFQGVTISDAMNMGSITGFYPTQIQTEIESFKAGLDVLLWPQLAFIDSVEAQINRGKIPMERLDDAVKRVWNMKEKLGLFDSNYQPIQPISPEQLTANNQKSQEIADKSLTLISNKHKIVPIDTLESKKILLTIVSNDNDKCKLPVVVEELQKRGYQVETRNNLPFFAFEPQMTKIGKTYDKCIFAFVDYPHHPWGSLDLSGDRALTYWTMNYLPMNKIISVSFGDPYKNLVYLPRTWVRINAYNTDAASQRSFVKALTGEIPFEGVSPVTYPFQVKK